MCPSADTFGLIFDVDGVIADTEAVNARATSQILADLFDLQGVRRADFAAGLGRGAAEYVQAAARVHGLTLNDQQITAATAAREKAFLDMLAHDPLPAFPGVLELINAAFARPDFRLAIATSGTRTKSQAVLESARIPYQRIAYITGSDVKNKKPHPELFLTACRAIDLPPTACLVIEDAPDGITAAHAAACKCLAVTNSTTPDKLAAADHIVASLTEIDIPSVINLITAS